MVWAIFTSMFAAASNPPRFANSEYVTPILIGVILIIILVVKFFTFRAEAGKWNISLAPDSITLNLGEQKGRYIPEGPPPTTVMRNQVASIVEFDGSLALLNSHSVILLSIPKDVERFDDLRSALDKWTAESPAVNPGLPPRSIPITKSISLSFIVGTAVLAILPWCFSSLYILVAAAIVAGLLGLTLALTQDLSDGKLKWTVFITRFCGVILFASAIARIVWFLAHRKKLD